MARFASGIGRRRQCVNDDGLSRYTRASSLIELPALRMLAITSAGCVLVFTGAPIVEKVALVTSSAAEWALCQPLQDVKVTFVTENEEWAAEKFQFTLGGESTLVDRLEALQKLLGGQEKLAAAAGLSVSGVKAWRRKGSEPGLMAAARLAASAGVSLDYVAHGVVRNTRDVEAEEIRFNLLKRDWHVSSLPLRRELRQQAIRKAEASIEEALRRFTLQPDGPSFGPGAGLSDEPDTLFAPPRLTITLGLPGLADGDAAPFGFSRDWLARQRLDPADLGMLDLQSSWHLVDLGQAARQLVDGCTYVVHDAAAGRFVLCRWRREDRALVLSDGRPLELERHLLPDAVVGRVVYVTPV